MGALEHLALDPARFIAETFGLRPALTATGLDHSWLGSLDAFDHLINDTLLPSAAFRLVKDGRPLPVKSYTKRFGGNRDDQIRIADPALVFDLFADGATVVLESLHNYSVPIRDFCRDLEAELRRGTQVNVYITPPGAQGFATHVDSHDVFVVQVHGTKHWLVHESNDPGGAGAPVVDHDLVAGECLYIPAGFSHSATTGATASAHLTIGILPNAVARARRELMSMMSLDEASLDVRQGGARDVGARLVDAFKKSLDEVDETELTRRLTRLFFSSRHHSLRGQLLRTLDAHEVGDSDKLVTRVEWVRFEDDDGTILLLPDRELRFGRRLTPALDVALRDEPFRVADLGPHLGREERREFVARLMREGLLELR